MTGFTISCRYSKRLSCLILTSIRAVCGTGSTESVRQQNTPTTCVGVPFMPVLYPLPGLPEPLIRGFCNDHRADDRLCHSRGCRTLCCCLQCTSYRCGTLSCPHASSAIERLSYRRVSVSSYNASNYDRRSADREKTLTPNAEHRSIAFYKLCLSLWNMRVSSMLRI
jgi:hypothetical protein